MVIDMPAQSPFGNCPEADFLIEFFAAQIAQAPAWPGLVCTSRCPSADEGQQYACGHRRADHAGYVGAHGMHQQEVLRVGFQADLIGYTGCHGHRGNPSRADQWVDFVLAEYVHQLGHQNARGCAGRERQHAKQQNAQGLDL